MNPFSECETKRSECCLSGQEIPKQLLLGTQESFQGETTQGEGFG